MSPHPIHILHLTTQWLRWAKIQPGPAPQVLGSGSLEGPPEQTLERWFEGVGDRRARIALYDGRPIYYSFILTLPTEALRQKERILKLKMAQEVGLSEDGVFWSARINSKHDNPAQSEVYMTVVRREAMQEVLTWRERRRLTHLWIGPDLCAIRALIGHAGTQQVIVNVDAYGVTLYHADALGRIIKERADEHTPARADMGWSGATGRLHFGGEIPGGLYDRYPTLAVLPRTPAAQLQHAAVLPRLTALTPEALELDGVVLGGLIEHAAGHAPAEDLIRVTTAPPMEALMAKLTLTRIVAVAAVLLAAMGAMGFRVYKDVKQLRDNLAGQTQVIEPSMRQLAAQELILRKVKSDRKQVRPVFEAIHQAVPGGGVVLKSFSLTEAGSINMEGTCKSLEAPNEFASAMGQSALLDHVVAKDIKFDPKTKIVTFRITGHIKGRGTGR